MNIYTDRYWQTIRTGNQIFCKIYSVFAKHNTLTLTTYTEDEALQLQVNETDLQNFADRCKIPLREYINSLKSILNTLSDKNEINIIHSNFVINTRLGNNMKLVYFEAPMEKVEFHTNILKAVEDFYIIKLNQDDELKKLREQCEQLQKDKVKMVNKFDEFVRRKKTDDDKLLSECVMLLNEKKRQIQHLNELLIAFKKGRPTLNTPNVIPTKKHSSNSKKVSKVCPIPKQPVLSESSADESTDSESKQNLPIIKKEIKLDVVPSTSELNLVDDVPSLSLSNAKRLKGSRGPDYHIITNQIKNEVPEETCSKMEVTEDSPTVDINTQELLNLI